MLYSKSTNDFELKTCIMILEFQLSVEYPTEHAWYAGQITIFDAKIDDG